MKYVFTFTRVPGVFGPGAPGPRSYFQFGRARGPEIPAYVYTFTHPKSYIQMLLAFKYDYESGRGDIVNVTSTISLTSLRVIINNHTHPLSRMRQKSQP